MKRLSLLMTLLVLVSGTAVYGQTSASVAGDVGDGHWVYGAVQQAAGDGWLPATEDHLFKPDAAATREFVAGLMVGAWPLAVEQGRAAALPETVPPTPVFSDMDGTTPETQRALYQLAAAGVIAGYPDGTVRPTGTLTRMEMAVMLSSACKDVQGGGQRFSDHARIPSWGRAALDRVSALGLVSGYGDGSFRPGVFVTRAEALQMVTQWAYPQRAKAVSRGSAAPSDPLAAEILQLVNQERTKRGLPLLGNNRTLMTLATEKAGEMASTNHFSHVSGTGEDTAALFRRYGLQAVPTGENLLRIRGSVTAETAVETWMNSPTHRDIILTPYTDTGIGLARASDGTIYVTQAFATF